MTLQIQNPVNCVNKKMKFMGFDILASRICKLFDILKDRYSNTNSETSVQIMKQNVFSLVSEGFSDLIQTGKNNWDLET